MISEGGRTLTFVYYDLETTGFSPSMHRICQMAFVLRTKGQVQKFCSLVNPDCEIPQRAQEVHGISTELAQEAPLFQEVWTQACAWLQNLLPTTAKICLVGHNSWRFDDPFLQAETARCNRQLSDLSPKGAVWSMDTLVMYRQQRQERSKGQKLPKESMRLGCLYQNLVGHELVGAHDALVDCLAVAEVHEVLLKQASDKFALIRSCLRHYEAPTKTPVSVDSFKRALDRLDDLRCLKKQRPSVEPLFDEAAESMAAQLDSQEPSETVPKAPAAEASLDAPKALLSPELEPAATNPSLEAPEACLALEQQPAQADLLVEAPERSALTDARPQAPAESQEVLDFLDKFAFVEKKEPGV
jgi:DNA polymerase III epsilon subunit-like protein